MYLQEIEKYFCVKKGKSLILSPKDWLLIKDWFMKGIPLSVVLQAIDETFANNPNPKKINSIGYCRQAIEENWEIYKENMVGSIRKDSLSKDNNISNFVFNRLDEIVEKIEGGSLKAEGNIYKEILSFFENLKNELLADENLCLSAAEEKFNILEEKVLLCLKNQLGEKSITEIEKQIDKELKEYRKKMSPETYEETRQHIFRKEILKKFSLTKIGLYD